MRIAKIFALALGLGLMGASLAACRSGCGSCQSQCNPCGCEKPACGCPSPCAAPKPCGC